MFELFPSREILLAVGSVEIRWYGIMYFLAFVIGLRLFERWQTYRNLSLTRAQIDGLLFSVVLGVIVGGRLGFVLLWEPSYFLGHPSDIIAIWKGGMSSHGGIVGVCIALVLFCRKHHIDLYALADVFAAPAALGLAFGRLGNFINLELYGTVTDLPWGMYFPGAEGLRHPTQIYAIIKDLIIMGVCYGHLRSTATNFVSGRTIGIFFMLYAVLRFLVEFVREQDGYVEVGVLMLSYGQMYSTPVLLAGLLILFMRRRKKILKY